MHLYAVYFDFYNVNTAVYIVYTSLHLNIQSTSSCLHCKRWSMHLYASFYTVHMLLFCTLNSMNLYTVHKYYIVDAAIYICICLCIQCTCGWLHWRCCNIHLYMALYTVYMLLVTLEMLQYTFVDVSVYSVLVAGYIRNVTIYICIGAYLHVLNFA